MDFNTITVEKEKEFVERVESFISQENTTWISNAQQKRKESTMQ